MCVRLNNKNGLSVQREVCVPLRVGGDWSDIMMIHKYRPSSYWHAESGPVGGAPAPRLVDMVCDGPIGNARIPM